VSLLGPLLLAVGAALVGALVFQTNGQVGGRNRAGHSVSLIEAFPVKVFCWAIGGIALLFLLSWYLETHCIFYKDVRF